MEEQETTQIIQDEPEQEKRTPSAATIILGAFAMIIGIITIVIAVQFPMNIGAMIDMRDVSAVVLAAVGILLSVISLVWGMIAHQRNKS